MQVTTAITKTTTVCRDPGPGLLVLWSSILLGMKQAFDDGMSSSAVWAVRHRKSISGQRRVPGQISTEMTKRLPPLQHPLKRGAVSHPRRLVDIDVVMIATILFCSGWQASIMPTKPLQIHDLVSTTAATGVFKSSPGEGATIDYFKGQAAEAGCGSSGCRPTVVMGAPSWWFGARCTCAHDSKAQKLHRSKHMHCLGANSMHATVEAGANWKHGPRSSVPRCQTVGPSVMLKTSPV